MRLVLPGAVVQRLARIQIKRKVSVTARGIQNGLLNKLFSEP